MAFCMNFGKQLPDGAKFCLECGTKLGDIETEQTTKRKTTYEGTVYKCPNCGDILDAYESVCETCGYERRGTKATNSVQELSRKLQEIESTRPPKTFVSFIKHAMNSNKLAKTDEQKIDLIKNFAVPNSKEDILEFAVLALSNIDPDAFSSLKNENIHDAANKAISIAWMAKFEQVYQKGILLCGQTEELLNIQQMYLKKKKAIRLKKAGLGIALAASFCACFILIFAICIVGTTASNNSKAKEMARLEALVAQVESAIAEEDYKLALTYADRIRYGGSYDAALDKDWKLQREYWIDKVIDEAAEAGVSLERPAEELNDEQTPTYDLTKENRIGATQYSFKYKNYLEVKKELEE